MNSCDNTPAPVPTTNMAEDVQKNVVNSDKGHKQSVTDDFDEDDLDLSASSNLSQAEALQGHETDSACEEDILDEDLAEPEPLIPQTVLDLADTALARLPPRWRNWITRVISGSILITGFSTLVSLGPIGLISLTYLVEYACFSEVFRLGKYVCGVKERYMSIWGKALFFVIHWIVMGEDLKGVSHLFKYHLAIGFSLYMGLIIFFVLSMEEKHYMKRYALFAWCHIWIPFFALPGHLMNSAMLKGMIWYVLPMATITINDIAAYMVGFFGGKTPLIKVSPKKTKEGFIGGGFLTLAIGTGFTYFLMTPYLVCPVETNHSFLEDIVQNYSAPDLFKVSNCQPKAMFQPSVIHVGHLSLSWYPFLLHGFLISLFSSLVGPFGGFLASGLKRACKRKNFGSLIPGHGGVLDRCDCMFLMAAFSYVYLTTLETANAL